MSAIVCAVYANREYIFSRRTKIASITGIAQPATIIIKRIVSVKFPIRTVGIARMKPVERLTTSERRARIFGIARVVKRDMLWTQPAPKDICIAPTKAVKRYSMQPKAANIIGCVSVAKKRTMRRWRVTHVRSITGSALIVSGRIQRREFTLKPRVARIIGGAINATITPVDVMPKTMPAIIAGGAPTMQWDTLMTKPVLPATGTAPIAKVARVTTIIRNLSVPTPGIAPIVSTGTRSLTAVAKRIGIVQTATTETRSMRLKTQRIAAIHGTARNVKKGIYSRKPVRTVIGIAKTKTVGVPIIRRNEHPAITPGIVMLMKNISVAKSDI